MQVALAQTDLLAMLPKQWMSFAMTRDVLDVIAVREKSKKQARVIEALELAKQIGFPGWVEVSVDKVEGVFKKTPDRDEFGSDINESLIVELYSR